MLNIPINKTEMNEDEKTVMNHLSVLSLQSIAYTRDYARICKDLINNYADDNCIQEIPLELQIAIDLLLKIDKDLEQYSISLKDDIKILKGELQRIE